MKRTYTPEQKQAVIDRYISGGESAASILADTEIPKSTFYNWLRAYRDEQNAIKRKTVNIRSFNLLENKVARLKGIIEILKSAIRLEISGFAKHVRIDGGVRKPLLSKFQVAKFGLFYFESQ